MFKVGVTGGIGSGKSTVCRLFAARGVAVYDTDAAAKELMNNSEERPRGERPLVELYLEPGGVFRTTHGRVTAPSC